MKPKFPTDASLQPASIQHAFSRERIDQSALQVYGDLSTAAAKLLIYQAFIEDETGFPKHLARRVHDLYFQPVYEEFQLRTMWSLSNAFTSAFKELEPIPQYKAAAKLAGFLQAVRSS